MNKYNEVEGNLITLSLMGKFDVITHGCNCFCTMQAGIAPQMVKAFGCDKFPKELPEYKGDINKLGTIDFKLFHQEKSEFGGKWVIYPDEQNFMTGKKLTICNSYTQYHYGANHKDGVKKPVDYDAITLCMRKINHTFKGQHIGLPYVIGCGLAGGDINIVLPIIKRELKDMDVTMVKYNKK